MDEPALLTRAKGADWWRRGIVYQIYPLSFQDTDGDGYGDLPGITRRLDYVASLGVDAIWLSPIYPSPMIDFGYDVADYIGIDPLFGTMRDFDELLGEAHRRGLRVILDLVPNHTSDLHPWFLESRSSRTNPKRDWYIWRDPAPGGGPPNNWMSYFGPAWTFDPRTGQHYFHQFKVEQPELNYRNPDVLEAMLGVMRFWLQKGVDGFRVDVIALLAKDDRFLDEPADPAYRDDRLAYHSLQHIYTQDQPLVHDYIRAMRGILDEYGGRALLGEIDPIPNLMKYYGERLDECHLPFNFNLRYLPWEATVLRQTIDAYDAAIPDGAWPNWVLDNHDQPRIGSRVGRAQIRVAQMLLLTLRGTPICYYGDEIGMTNVPIPPNRIRDWNGTNREESLRHSRDPQRTPMQWGPGPNAGFSPGGVQTWLPVAPDHEVVNVSAQDRDERSTLTLFRRLVALRRKTAALRDGTYRSIAVAPEEAVLAYERRSATDRALVVLNLTGDPARVDLGAVAQRGEVVLSTLLDRSEAVPLSELALRPDEGVIVELSR